MYNTMSLASFEYPKSRKDFDSGASYVRSQFLSPRTFAYVRAIIALYCWTTIIVAYSWLAYEQAHNSLRDVNIPPYTQILDRGFIAKSFSFFTFIVFWSQAFYFMISSWHTFTYARRAPSSKSHLHDDFPRLLQFAHSLWHTTIITYPFLVSIVYWSSMYAPPWSSTKAFTRWINISVHGLNGIFAILEIICSAVKPPPFVPHLSAVLLGLSLYLGLAYLTKVDQGFYVYEWMDPKWGWRSIMGHILAYAGGMVVIYCAVWVGIWIRERLLRGRASKRVVSNVASGTQTAGDGV
ncbi:hypothetical protein CKM354_000962800 [Cercospora kikuchii]|uniref:Uncharacterized protein n=1 Tax=Cercospora kikuchii TaxID=84275 RepID=A0A9P3FJ97_9PEZI|nr:uncharacterized protein CKM354_000962800 [Cercospora kikuchii]GIZ46502.1 hypothetical protein CKM354_000962800 [Cercospora kikuchii]